jgi:hypothetical protein
MKVAQWIWILNPQQYLKVSFSFKGLEASFRLGVKAKKLGAKNGKFEHFLAHCLTSSY